MKNRIKTIIRSYIEYFVGHIGKLLFFLVIVFYMYPNFEIDFFKSIRNSLFYYIGYMSIYFFNDYIDRENDLKRAFIHPRKLVLTKKELLILGILSISISLALFIFVKDFIAIIVLLISILIGTIRSFYLEKNIRELSLIILAFFKLFSIYYLVYNSLNIDFFSFILFLNISLVYAAGYYIHKYPLEKFRKILYFIAYPIVGLLVSALFLIILKNIYITLITLLFSIVFLQYVYSIFKKEIKKEEVKKIINELDLKNILLTLLMIILIILRFIRFY